MQGNNLLPKKLKLKNENVAMKEIKISELLKKKLTNTKKYEHYKIKRRAERRVKQYLQNLMGFSNSINRR